MLPAVVHQRGMNLIHQHPRPKLGRQIGDPHQFLPLKHKPQRVIRVTQQQTPGTLRKRFPQLPQIKRLDKNPLPAGGLQQLKKRGIGRHRHNNLRTRRRKVLNGNQQRPHHIRNRMHPLRQGHKPIPVPVKIRRRLGQPGLVLRRIPERLRRHRRLNRIHHRRAGDKITLRHPQRKNISPITGPLHSVSGLQLIVRRKTHVPMVVLMKVRPRRTTITTRYYA